MATTRTMKAPFSLSALVCLFLTNVRSSGAFVAPSAKPALLSAPTITSAPFGSTREVWRLHAGGFEWEDPGDFDQGVENPFKNEELMKSEGKIDPARLLGPRLNGSNLYLVGMMGTGKSTVGDIVARRKSKYFLSHMK